MNHYIITTSWNKTFLVEAHDMDDALYRYYKDYGDDTIEHDNIHLASDEEMAEIEPEAPRTHELDRKLHVPRILADRYSDMRDLAEELERENIRIMQIIKKVIARPDYSNPEGMVRRLKEIIHSPNTKLSHAAGQKGPNANVQ